MATKLYDEILQAAAKAMGLSNIDADSVAFALDCIDGSTIDTLVFDVDDTLYTFECGFTVYRNTKVIEEYMVTKLGFKDRAAAKAFRDPLFKIHHTSVKLLQLASDNGTLPLQPDGTRAVFRTEELAEAFATCDMHKYLDQCVDAKLFEALRGLKQTGLKLVVFSNAPRRYCLKVLEVLTLLPLFDTNMIFGVDDIPYAKPDPNAFHHVLSKVGSSAQHSVMFEDSMKNIRAAKSIGMKTCLVTGTPETFAKNKPIIHAIKGGDVPDAADKAVDYALHLCRDLPARMPFLWHKRWRSRAV